MGRTSGTPGRSVQQLKHADLKIKCSKCKVFKSKVHYLSYLVGVDGVQPLPEKLEAIKKLLTPTNVGEVMPNPRHHRFLQKICTLLC